MKKIYLLIFTIACFHIAKAQNPVPNPDFENWTSGVPDGWSIFNLSQVNTNITQVTPGYDTTYAAKGQTFVSGGDTIAPFLSTINIQTRLGTPISQNYDSLNVYYKCNLLNNDTFLIYVVLYSAHQNPVAASLDYINGIDSVFTQDNLQFYYFYPDSNAAYADILFYISNSVTTNLESYFIVDDVSLTGGGTTTGVNELATKNKIQVFPVPAHDWLTVKGKTDNNKPMQFELIDAMGRVVMDRKSATPSNNFIDADLSLQGLAPGLYSLMMITDEEVTTRRIVVQ